MSERDLDGLLLHLREKLFKFVNQPNAWQVEIHGKGVSIQVKVTEVNNLPRGQSTLDERR